MRILDKSLNLDVQGQGCWSDCYRSGFWSLKKSSSTKDCYWTEETYNEYNSILW